MEHFRVQVEGFPALPPTVSAWFLAQKTFVLSQLPKNAALSAAELAQLFLKLWSAPVAPGDTKSQAQWDELEVTVSAGAATAHARGPRLKIQDFVQEQKAFGTVDVIYEKAAVFGLYRLNIAPGARIPLHRHDIMAESELILGDGLRLNGVAVQPGEQRVWQGGEPHEYQNSPVGWSTILCLDAPPFIPEDEIEI